jgi:hypothetical protein
MGIKSQSRIKLPEGFLLPEVQKLGFLIPSFDSF